MFADRGVPSLMLIYLGVLTLVGGAAIYGLSALPTVEGTKTNQIARAKTILHKRIATAREIKHSLHKGIPAPETLPPITAKVANGSQKALAGSNAKPTKAGVSNPSPQARNSFASSAMPPTAPSYSASAYDRHGVNSH